MKALAELQQFEILKKPTPLSVYEWRDHKIQYPQESDISPRAAEPRSQCYRYILFFELLGYKNVNAGGTEPPSITEQTNDVLAKKHCLRAPARSGG